MVKTPVGMMVDWDTSMLVHTGLSIGKQAYHARLGYWKPPSPEADSAEDQEVAKKDHEENPKTRSAPFPLKSTLQSSAKAIATDAEPLTMFGGST